MIFPDKRRTLVLPQHIKSKDLVVAFFDADQTLRKARSGKASPHGRHDVAINRQAFSKLKQLTDDGIFMAIVSNQAGIELGYISISEVEEAMHGTMHLFAEKGVFFNYYDYAEHYDEDRKPEPGMAWRLERLLHLHGYAINWAESFMVGDAAWKESVETRPDGKPGTDHSNSDRRFAENIANKYHGFGFFHPDEFFGKAIYEGLSSQIKSRKAPK